MNITQCQFPNVHYNLGIVSWNFAKLEDLGITLVGDQLLRLFAELVVYLHHLIQVVSTGVSVYTVSWILQFLQKALH